MCKMSGIIEIVQDKKGIFFQKKEHGFFPAGPCFQRVI